MKIFPASPLNEPIHCLLFDMDNTLYTNKKYALHQEQVLVQRLAREKNWTYAEAQGIVDTYRTDFASQNRGQKPSLGNTFLTFGISIQQSVEWRNEFICPQDYLLPDPQLQETLQILGNRYTLGVVTNNPREIAYRTLEILGVLDFFPVVVGLDSTGVSKPNPEGFRLAAEICKSSAEYCVSIGDRYEVDIQPALDLGMQGILVNSVQDIYQIPIFLNNTRI